MSSSQASETQPLLNETSSETGVGPRQTIHREGTEVELVSFPPGDQSNPRNWPSWRRWSIVAVIVPVDLTISWGASCFSPGAGKFEKEFEVSHLVGTLGLSCYVLGLAFGPMTLAPLSEYYGRSPIYIFSYAINLLFIVGAALVQNVGGFLILRFLSAFFASVTIANFGGTIADLFEPHETGTAMSLYLWAATFGSPSGFCIFSFVAQSRPWRHIFWTLLGVNGTLWLIMSLTLKETRHSVILSRRAAKERKESGKPLDVPDSMKQRGWRQLFSVALTRPFRFLVTEGIVIFGAIYNGYLYGLSFLFNGAFPLIFGPKGHGFGTIGVGLSFLGIMIGISFGPISNVWQERYYRHRVAGMGGRNIPEARVQLSQIAGIMLPIATFWFAWTSKSFHWIVPIIASSLWGWSFYTLILMTFQYTEDSYKARTPTLLWS